MSNMQETAGEPGLGRMHARVGSSLTLWRGEGLPLLLAPAYGVDVGAAGVTPEIQEDVTVPGDMGRAEPAVLPAWHQGLPQPPW